MYRPFITTGSPPSAGCAVMLNNPQAAARSPDTSWCVSDRVASKTLNAAKKITNQDVAQKLGGLHSIKMHCSNLAADALKKAINNFEQEN